MKHTWLIENTYTKNVYEYCTTLKEAKECLLKICKNRPIEFNAGLLCILKLEGQYYGEGRHVYRCTIDPKNNKFFYVRY
jgi:hypothetical protein